MDRRALLVALGGLAAGCTGTTPSGNASPTPDTPVGTPPAGATLRLRVDGVETTHDGPDHRYVLEPTAFSSGGAVERERADSAEPVVDYVTGLQGGTYTHVGFELYERDPTAPPALCFDATVTDPWVGPDDPGTVAFALRNEGDRELSVFSGTVPPFGVVFAERTDGDRLLLWRPYTEQGCVSFGEMGLVSCDIGRTTPIAPGDSLTRAYGVLPPATETRPAYTAAEAGDYEVEFAFPYNRDVGPGSTLSATVAMVLADVDG